MGKRIEDEFTALPISSQRRYQLRAQRDSKCIICGIPTPGGKSLCEQHQRKKKYKDAMRRVAHAAVLHALKEGWMTRRPCEVCGAAAHAHHEDYLKPLTVRWLCPMHRQGFEAWIFETTHNHHEGG